VHVSQAQYSADRAYIWNGTQWLPNTGSGAPPTQLKLSRLLPVATLMATILLASCGDATTSATSSPTGQPTVSKASPTSGPTGSKVTGFGALKADWNAHHTAQGSSPNLTAGCCYNYDPKLLDSPHYRYVNVDLDAKSGRVLGYTMVLYPNTTIADARAQTMAELPSDATVVFFVASPCNSSILEAKSATLVPIFSQPAIGGDGTVDFTFFNADAQGTRFYDPKNIEFVDVTIGLGLASAQSGPC
jgi:hypothetical protein